MILVNRIHQLLAVIFLFVGIIVKGDNIEIKLMELSYIEEVKQMIMESVLDVWQLQLTIEELKQEVGPNEWHDIDEFQSVYCDDKGALYIALDQNKVVGSGAIKRLDHETCELKRMWFLKEYRGKGFGLAMANTLIEFAKNQGYTTIRLDVWRPTMQQQAVTFYKKLGFYEIQPYKDCPAELFMEKKL
jgi:putative acetyltransferase